MSQIRNPLTAPMMKKIIKVIEGKEKADLAILHGDIVDVYTGKIIKDHSVAVKGDWIAYINSDISQTIGPDTAVIDASGKILIPGMIDSHTHMVYYSAPWEAIRYLVPGGTTTIITEIMEISYTMGYNGLLQYLEALKDQPIKMFITVPPPISLSKSVYSITPNKSELKKLLRRDDVLGLGESYWQHILKDDKLYADLAQESLRLGKTIEGHTAGAHGSKLESYLAYGVSSCHEPVNADDVLERLRLGCFVMIREGSMRRDLEEISKINKMDIDYHHLAISTDGIDPGELITTGYMETVLQKAIDVGFDPIKAIQMVTLNPARHFRLDSYTGGIGLSKHADIVIIPDLKTIKAEYVISKGEIVARNGKLTAPVKKAPLPDTALNDYINKVSPAQFSIPCQKTGTVSVRVMDQVTDLVTRDAIMPMTARNGELNIDTTRDILKVTLITRQNKIVNAFIRGYKLKTGAVASSNAWENFGVLAVGVSEQDIALAVNHLLSMGGGIVVADGGKILAELPLPIGGLISKLSIEEIVDRLSQINKAAKSIGFPFPDLPKTIAVLTTPAIPFLRLSEDGLYDLKTNKIVDLITG
jgi:adenine deaminase